MIVVACRGARHEAICRRGVSSLLVPSRRTRERPAYHPGTLLKIYVYGYLNRIQSSRRLEREAQRNVELIWLTGRLAPDFKTIADFRRDNGPAIRTDRNRFAWPSANSVTTGASYLQVSRVRSSYPNCLANK